MENYIAKRNYTIFIYSEEDREKYAVAIEILRRVNRINSVYDRIQGVTILEDCRIPKLYHGNDLAIICERDEGSGKYSCEYMSESV